MPISFRQRTSQPVGQLVSRSVGQCCWPKATMLKLELCCIPLPIWKLNERSGIVVGGQTSASEPLSIVTLFASKWWPLPSFPVAPTYLYGIALIKWHPLVCKGVGKCRWVPVRQQNIESQSVVYSSVLREWGFTQERHCRTCSKRRAGGEKWKKVEFILANNTKLYGWVDLWLRLFFISALDIVEWSDSSSDRSTAVKIALSSYSIGGWVGCRSCRESNRYFCVSYSWPSWNTDWVMYK